MSNRIIKASLSAANLTKEIVATASRELTGYDRTLRDEDMKSLDAVARTVGAMASDRAASKFYIAVQPTGWGKTATLAAAVRAIVYDPTQADVGVVIFVSELRQIEELVKRIGLRPDQFVVRTGKNNIDLNNMGRTGLCQTEKCREKAHRRAQVLFTTQQKLTSLTTFQADFNHMKFFHYCGADYPDDKNSCRRVRAVRLWDEAFVPIDPVIITHSQIAQFADRLIAEGQPDAAKVLLEWSVHIQAALPSFDTVPNWIPHLKLGENEKLDKLFERLASGGEEHDIVAGALFWLAGKEVKIIRQDYNSQTVSISYRRSVPYNIEPLLIFDAGGSRAMQYRFMNKNHQNVVVLPEVKKSYRNLVVRYVDEAAGKTVYRSRQGVEKLATIVAQAVSEKPVGEEVLIIHRLGEKAPASTFCALVREKVRAMDGDTGLLRFRHYGLHVATNDFQDIKHVILVGIYQAPRSAIIAMVYGTSSKPMHAKISPTDLELMRMSRIVGDLNQAIGRGATRKMIDGDIPTGCTVDIIGSSWGPMGFKDPLGTLSQMFPGAKVEEWYPRIPSVKPTAKITTVDAALELLGGLSEALVTTGEWAAKSGYDKRTLQRVMKSGEIVGLLGARGIAAEKCGARWLLKRKAEKNDSSYISL